jgi:hypothetical protein
MGRIQSAFAMKRRKTSHWDRPNSNPVERITIAPFQVEPALEKNFS